jgi:hypothetical protein
MLTHKVKKSFLSEENLLHLPRIKFSTNRNNQVRGYAREHLDGHC